MRKLTDVLVKSYKLNVALAGKVRSLKSKMKLLRKKGFTYEKIGKRLNLCVTTVWNHLNKYSKTKH